ncbi:MAG: flagellar protein FliT, partial [Gammaproteobacteria bacterium]|nr:flagellar protein FliT [Gammaproteobacteria bacterium]
PVTAAVQDSLARQLDDLLVAGRQMLAAAREGDWSRADTLQSQCHRMAEALFAEPVPAASAAAVAETIGELMELHNEVMQLCSHTREDFMQEIGNLNQGRQAVSEYTSNSG